jgi:hypothetical protein
MSMSLSATPQTSAEQNAAAPPSGAGAAAILAAGIGACLLALFAILGDKVPSLKSFFTFSKPTGPLSGVTTCAIAAWMIAWAVFHVWWRRREVAMRPVAIAALALLFLSLLLTFPPIADLF